MFDVRWSRQGSGQVNLRGKVSVIQLLSGSSPTLPVLPGYFTGEPDMLSVSHTQAVRTGNHRKVVLREWSYSEIHQKLKAFKILSG